MTPEALADIHRAAFVVPRPWHAAEIAALLAEPAVFLLTAPQGFLMGRVAAGEAELLTVAVLPQAQGAGIGGALVARFLEAVAAQGAGEAFLEVAEDNAVARSVYARAGFADVGRRKGYFHAPDGRRVDAIVMRAEVSPASA